jgi:environmental stress-induced protein Ves
MTTIRRLTQSDVERQPWRNGRGETAQIALWPPSSTFAKADFDWRVSRAAVTEPGPFSTFPGYDRVLVIVGGDGIDLRHEERAPPAHVAAWQPYRFSGDWPTTAELVAGPVLDLNVFTRRDRAAARVRVAGGEISREPLVPAGEHLLVHVIAGHVGARIAASAMRLEPFDTLWIREPAGKVAVTFEAADARTRLVVVEIDRAAEAR